jgi:hypothetical protein
MNATAISRRLPLFAVGALSLSLFAGCSTPTAPAANVPAAQRAFELAVACKTNEALLDTDAAERSGGPGSSLAGVERIIILQEAGRPATAAGARDVYIGKLGNDKAKIEELDRNVASGVAKLRAERKARTGKESC